jgi:hypothetical protein
MTSNAKAEARFGKRDFRYVADEDVYVCPAGEKLSAAGSQSLFQPIMLRIIPQKLNREKTRH